MHGRRARIGALVVSDDVTTECEYAAMAPAGVSVHAARMRIDDALPAVERLERMSDFAASAAADLGTARPDAIIYACTSGSFFKGLEWTRRHMAELEALTGCKLVATATASIAALKAVGASRIAVATPYEDEVNRLLASYFTDAGLTVTGMAGAGLHSNWDVVAMTERDIAALCREADHADADAIFFSCTAVPIVAQIDALETSFAKPVVTANQASFWSALRTAGIQDAVPGFGSLLSRH